MPPNPGQSVPRLPRVGPVLRGPHRVRAAHGPATTPMRQAKGCLVPAVAGEEPLVRVLVPEARAEVQAQERSNAPEVRKVAVDLVQIPR